MTTPQLGHHLELCFSVDNLKKSIQYYQKLGFSIYSGGPDQSYCSMKSELGYISLFSDNFIEKEFGHPFILNYRGGNINKLSNSLKENNIEFTKENIQEDGTGNILFYDPSGVPIFLDTAHSEERVDMNS